MASAVIARNKVTRQSHKYYSKYKDYSTAMFVTKRITRYLQ